MVVTEVTSELHFYAQHADQGAKLEALMNKLRQDFQSNPPITGSYTPKRGDLCAAKFSEDNEWYRAEIEKIQGGNATLRYIDYGNKEVAPTTRLASLPAAFSSDKPYAVEYCMAFIQLPADNEYKDESARAFAEDVLNRNLLLNVEYKANNVTYVTLTDPKTNVDVGKNLVKDGLVLIEKRREKRLKPIMEEYKEAEQAARKSRHGIWEYGDVTQDEAAEFGR